MPVRRCLPAAVLAGALLLSACSSSKGSTSTSTSATVTSTTTTTVAGSGAPVPVARWTSAFCHSFGDWFSSIKKTLSKTHTSSGGSIADRKKVIEGLFGDASTETQHLIDAITRLGAPDIPHGAQLEPDLVQKFRDFRDESDRTRDAVASASDTDETAFEAAATHAFDAFKQNVQAIGDSFGQLDAKYPDRQFQQGLTSSCSSITG